MIPFPDKEYAHLVTISFLFQEERTTLYLPLAAQEELDEL